jgi:hypothetical protein
MWHTSPVTLRWSWDVNSEPAPLVGSECASPVVIDKDTPGRNVMCAVWDVVSHKIVNATATVRVDMTAPSVTGFTPARPVDYGGWWNHPVALAFQGADGTSGIASCDTVNYSGPDSAAAQVTGACRDAAGNSAARTFAIKYDATTPALTVLTPAPGDSHVTLKWTTSPDVVLTEIVRSPGIGHAPASTVYSGRDTSFTDPGVRSGTAYTYSITSVDEAANPARAVQTVTPTVPLFSAGATGGADRHAFQAPGAGRRSDDAVLLAGAALLLLVAAAVSLFRLGARLPGDLFRGGIG